jgi:catechol 2,3-dioxygenase-like lactoylglutathione lyase family enzyme
MAMAPNTAPSPWRGINHLALVTPDMDATVRFYHGVLGMRLVATVMAGPMRHYFFETAPGNTVAFFEVSGVDQYTLAAGVPDARKAQFDHLSFNVADEAALEALRKRLLAEGCEVTVVVDHDIMKSIYFTDPHGIALEASAWMADVTSGPVDYGNDRIFSDPDPVSAVRELATGGDLAWKPRTVLAGEPISDPA